MKDIFVNTLRADNSKAFQKTEFIKLLQKTLQGRVDEAYVFGSFAQGKLTRDSDIDLILIKPSTTTFVERPLEFQDLYDLGPEIDILVYTPQEFIKLTENPSPGFWRSVVSTMEKIL